MRLRRDMPVANLGFIKNEVARLNGVIQKHPLSVYLDRILDGALVAPQTGL